MPKSKNVIRIPKMPTDAFNLQRPVSELLWTQVEHLAAVVRREIDEERRAIRTEGQASAFVKKYTALLHPQDAGKKTTTSSKGPQKGTKKNAQKKQPRAAKK